MRSLNSTVSAEGHAAIVRAEAEPGWLLVGKLAPPQQRIAIASHDILLERLDASLSRSVSLIISPAGFGKTTLLTQWWRTLEARSDIFACWLTLDEIDSEVSRFVAGVILAVARAGVEVGPLEVAARQQSIDPNVGPIALALLGALFLVVRGRLCLVGGDPAASFDCRRELLLGLQRLRIIRGRGGITGQRRLC